MTPRGGVGIGCAVCAAAGCCISTCCGAPNNGVAGTAGGVCCAGATCCASGHAAGAGGIGVGIGGGVAPRGIVTAGAGAGGCTGTLGITGCGTVDGRIGVGIGGGVAPRGIAAAVGVGCIGAVCCMGCADNGGLTTGGMIVGIVCASGCARGTAPVGIAGICGTVGGVAEPKEIVPVISDGTGGCMAASVKSWGGTPGCCNGGTACAGSAALSGA
ncbi:MAG: hypothetical protein LBF92_00500 [Synergistaceae bacterium]|nr:hypothetical protein [Synergistaceae bacterium]